MVFEKGHLPDDPEQTSSREEDDVEENRSDRRQMAREGERRPENPGNQRNSRACDEEQE